MVNQNGSGTQLTVVKAKFGFDIRKMQLYHNNDLSLNDIISMMQRLFQIKDGNSIHLKYRDEDGDWITIADDNDLNLAAHESPSLFMQVYTDDDELRSHFTNLKSLINDFNASTKELASSIQKLSCGYDNSKKIDEKSTKPSSPIQQKLENDNVAVIKPEQAEFSNIPLNSSRSQESPSQLHNQVGDPVGNQPSQFPYNMNTVSQQYHMPGPGHPQKFENYQQQYAPPPSQQSGVQVPPPPQQQPQFQTPHLPQPPISTFQPNVYNPTPPPTSMYQQIPQQQNFGPPSQIQPQQQYGVPTPQPPTMMGGAAGGSGNPFARQGPPDSRNIPQGFRSTQY